MEEDTSGNNHVGMPIIIEDSGRRFCSIQSANIVVTGLRNWTFSRLCREDGSVHSD